MPAYPEGETIATGDGKPPTPATLKLFWAIESGGPDQPGRLWAGTAPGGLFRSDDGGKSWELVRGAVGPPRADEVVRRRGRVPRAFTPSAATRGSEDAPHRRLLRRRVDHATTTAQRGRIVGTGLFAEFMPPEQRGELAIQDVHMMTQCRSAPEYLWIQHHNGIFRSTDGGGHLRATSRTPSRLGFGFGVAVHPNDPGTPRGSSPAVKDETRIPGGWATRGQPYSRRWKDLRCAPQRPSAGERLRPHLPPRAGNRRYGQPPRDGLDDRRRLGQRRPGRPLAGVARCASRRSTR